MSEGADSSRSRVFRPTYIYMANAVQRISTFVQEVREELGRVSWPTREELLGSALVVFVGVALLGGYIAIWDFVLSKAARWLLR